MFLDFNIVLVLFLQDVGRRKGGGGEEDRGGGPYPVCGAEDGGLVGDIHEQQDIFTGSGNHYRDEV